MVRSVAPAFVGVYGVASYGVSQRKREIGVRLALGATGREAIMLLAAGASELLRTMLFGLPSLDPVAFLGVAGLLLAVALLAMYAPTRKAAQVDPALTLRQE